MIELARRRSSQPPADWFMWEVLADPIRDRDERRHWLVLRHGEVFPSVVEAIRPTRVLWSSLWPARPDDHLCFEIAPDGSGCVLTWILLSPEDPPDAQIITSRRHRGNRLINADLRCSLGQ